jgi:hypothetical protein
MPILPKTDLSTDAPAKIKNVCVMTEFTVQNEAGGERISATFIKHRVNTATGEVLSAVPIGTVTRKVSSIENAQVLAAIDLLTTKLEQARVADGL